MGTHLFADSGTRHTPGDGPGHEVTPDDVTWARAIALWHARRSPELREEYESAALLALAHAARRFGPDMETDFRGYAATAVHRGVINARHAWYGRSGHGRNDATTRTVSLRAETIAAPSPRPSYDDPDYVDEVRVACRRLPVPYRAAFYAVFGDGLTQAEAARKLCVCKSHVSQTIGRSLALLRDGA